MTDATTPDAVPAVGHVLVLGGGTAGLLAAVTLRLKVPGVRVTVLRSKEIGVIGVGEGTTAFFPSFLHGYLRVSPVDFVRLAGPTFKLGTHFLWGPRPSFQYPFAAQFAQVLPGQAKAAGYYAAGADAAVDGLCLNAALMSADRAFERRADRRPVLRGDVAYHVENARFVDYLEQLATLVGATVEDDTAVGVERSPDGGVAALACASGRRRPADLFVDCSGFAATLLGTALAEPLVSFGPSLLCDRAVVGGWARPAGDPVRPYTTAETMDHGWAWQIELEHRVNRGLVYSSALTTDDAAEAELRRKNPRLEDARVVRFTSGRRRRGWVGNVVALGNAYGFVEPLEATALVMICDACKTLATLLVDADRRPADGARAVYNARLGRRWDAIRAFLAVHYKFNTRLDTPFWRAARADTDLADAAAFVDFYQDVGPSLNGGDLLLQGQDVFGVEGYLTMMVGMDVPYRLRHAPTDVERAAWEAAQAPHRATAARGVSVAEVLAQIRRDDWLYDYSFYTAG